MSSKPFFSASTSSQNPLPSAFSGSFPQNPFLSEPPKPSTFNWDTSFLQKGSLLPSKASSAQPIFQQAPPPKDLLPSNPSTNPFANPSAALGNPFVKPSPAQPVTQGAQQQPQIQFFQTSWSQPSNPQPTPQPSQPSFFASTWSTPEPQETTQQKPQDPKPQQPWFTPFTVAQPFQAQAQQQQPSQPSQPPLQNPFLFQKQSQSQPQPQPQPQPQFQSPFQLSFTQLTPQAQPQPQPQPQPQVQPFQAQPQPQFQPQFQPNFQLNFTPTQPTPQAQPQPQPQSEPQSQPQPQSQPLATSITPLFAKIEDNPFQGVATFWGNAATDGVSDAACCTQPESIESQYPCHVRPTSGVMCPLAPVSAASLPKYPHKPKPRFSQAVRGTILGAQPQPTYRSDQFVPRRRVKQLTICPSNDDDDDNDSLATIPAVSHFQRQLVY